LCLPAASPGGARAQDPETAVRAEPTRSTSATGEPDNVAGPVLVLCSEDGSYVTGQALMVDEGGERDVPANGQCRLRHA
jgi:NAD(P)-dependent dehydrogenase (short-subunit alcohol dehydrogenase family)